MKSIFLLSILLSLALFSGCAGNSELIKTCGKNMRGDVFREVSDQSPVPNGYADLLVVSSLKTHRPGYHHSDDAHGTSEYRLLINIDGQAAVIPGKLVEESIEPRKLGDPEAGEGIRYGFGKHLRLKAGMHNLVIALPDDNVAVAREITLVGGSANRLAVEPVYGTKRSGGRMTMGVDKDYKEGIKGFQLILNGKAL